VVWDWEDSTETAGRGPYWVRGGAPNLRPGPVFAAWTCSGPGRLTVVPAHVAYDGEVPPSQSPLAFQVTCPTIGGPSVLTWRQLPSDAVGGENVAQVYSALQPSTAVSYRIVLAQAAP
jgi:hypothetical protein